MPIPPELEALKRLADASQKVKIGQGVVGRTTGCAIVFLAVWGLALWKLSGNPWLDIPIMAAAFVITGVFVWFVRSTRDYAVKHPALAMLEGAEFVQYKQVEAQAKGLKIEGSARPVSDPKAPLPLTSKKKRLRQADQGPDP